MPVHVFMVPSLQREEGQGQPLIRMEEVTLKETLTLLHLAGQCFRVSCNWTATSAAVTFGVQAITPPLS